MTILFFLKPYQFFDRGGVLKKHVEDANLKRKKLDVESPKISEPVLEDPLKLELSKQKAEFEKFKKKEQAFLEAQRKKQEREAQELELKAIEQALKDEQKRREYEEFLERERLASIERARIREEKRVARVKRHAILRQIVRKGRAEKERLRIEMEESDIRELIFVINQHLEDNPY